ncbi:MAG: hypothetical protein FWH17_06770 [Oscillospiraceae bacterium]|nr:hypothetical protein [Oscillospiraceae bacterium]
MNVSIYISAEQIQAVEHEGKKAVSYTAQPLPEGVMYNGTIIDHSILLEALNAMKRKNPSLFTGKVTLVVDGSSLLNRKISSPRLSRKQYLNLIRDDFADSFESSDEIVCGYSSLPASEGAILGFAANRAQVDSYTSVFAEAGIALGSIRVGTEALLGFVSEKPELQKGVAAVNVIDGMTMLTAIFVNGSNVFMSRTRLYGEAAQEKLTYILDNLNGLMQFTQSQKLGSLTHSYYVGIGASEVAYMQQQSPHEGITLCALAVQGRGEQAMPIEAHFCLFAAYLGRGNVDLIAARRELDKYIKSKGPKKAWLIFLIVYIFVLSAPAVYFLAQSVVLRNDIDDINAFLSSAEVQRALTEIETLRVETIALNEISTQAENVFAWQRSLPIANAVLLDEVIFDHGVDVVAREFNFNDRTGVVRLTASCTDSKAPNDFIETLLKSPLVSDIRYQGFTGSTGETFTFTVDIYLNGGGMK